MFTDKRLNIINMSFPCNLVYRLNAIAIKIPGSYFVDIDKYSKVYMERHKTQNSQDNIEGEQSQKTDTDFKTYCKATGTNAGSYR